MQGVTFTAKFLNRGFVQVAHFEYEPVGLRKLIVPPFQIEHKRDIKALLINRELDKISRNAQAVNPSLIGNVAQ